MSEVCCRCEQLHTGLLPQDCADATCPMQGKILLATDRNGEHNRSGMVLVPVHATGGNAMLPGLNVTGVSSYQTPTQVYCRPFLAVYAHSRVMCYA